MTNNNFKILKFIIMLILYVGISQSQNINLKYDSDQEKLIFEKYRINRDTTFDNLNLWLISEGISDDKEINLVQKSFDLLLSEIKNRINKKDDYEDQSEDIFLWFHKNLFKTYDDNARIKDLLLDGKINLINANAIYYLVCKIFNLPITFISNSYYLENRLYLTKRAIDIDIIDKTDGFDTKFNKNKFIKLLQELDIIKEYSTTEKGDASIYSEFYKNFIPVDPYDIMGFIYQQRAETLNELSNFEAALVNIEKAISLSPGNEIFRNNYKVAFGKLSALYTDVDHFIPYYKNSLYILADDKSYTMSAIQIAAQILYQVTEAQRNYSKALDLILEFKTLFTAEEYLKKMNEIEIEIEFDQIRYYSNRGCNDSAYIKVKDLYAINNANLRNKTYTLILLSNTATHLFPEKKIVPERI